MFTRSYTYNTCYRLHRCFVTMITKIINLSLQTGEFAVRRKCTLVLPLLKKLGLEIIAEELSPRK